MESLTAWRNQSSSYAEALNYIKGRQTGDIKSVKLPWDKVNDATLQGLEWQSLVVIGARPGTGKTAVKDQIVREVFDLNPDQKMRVLEFSLEMVGRVSAIRSMSADMGESYKYLCSADNGPISDADIERCKIYAEKMSKLPIDTVEESPTVIQLGNIIDEYMRTHAVITGDEKIYTKTIITLDHSLLLTKKPGQSQKEMLEELGLMLTKKKRAYPIIFIVLSQLNRNIDHPERNEEGRYGNYVLESDIFGGDALLQHADLALGLNRPGKQKLRLYGPDRYIIQDENLLVMHFLKARNGVIGLCFFEARFHEMKIVETVTPPTQTSRISTISN